MNLEGGNQQPSSMLLEIPRLLRVCSDAPESRSGFRYAGFPSWQTRKPLPVDDIQ
jgi:hypothetical protein